jgi:hypothetical protein
MNLDYLLRFRARMAVRTLIGPSSPLQAALAASPESIARCKAEGERLRSVPRET